MYENKLIYILQKKTRSNKTPTILEIFNEKPSRLQLYHHIMEVDEPTEAGLRFIELSLNSIFETLGSYDEPNGYNVGNDVYYLSKHKVDWDSE